jgi:hypothetical protein
MFKLLFRHPKTFLCLLFLMIVGLPPEASAQAAPVQNPGLVIFTPSPDHANITSYKLEIIRVSDGSVIQTLDVGKPAPCVTACPTGVAVGEASAAINVQPIAFGDYTAQMRSVAGAVTGPASPASDPWQRAPGSPSKPKLK